MQVDLDKSSESLTQMRKSSQVSWPIVVFWATGVMWGGNFLFMKWAADVVSPTQVTLFRIVFGFLPVALYAYVTKALSLQHLKYTGHFVVMSVLATTLHFYGFAKGTSLLPSGIAGALSGMIPLFAFGLGAAFLNDERVNRVRSIAILCGLCGVGIIADPFRNGFAPNSLAIVYGSVYMMLGAASLGAAFVYARKYLSHLDIPPAALATYQLAFATITLLLISDYTGMEAILNSPKAAFGLVFGAGLFGTGITYITYYYIVRTLGAVTASSATYIPPVIALFIGAVLMHEPIQLHHYLGTVLIFAGVVLLRGR